MNDNLDQIISRRTALRQGACAALGLGGLMSQVFTMRGAMAAVDNMSSLNDYKALVCIFLFGGNDAGNMLIPYDGGNQNYADYAAGRTGLALPFDSFASNGTVIAPTNASSRRFALHPAMTDVANLFSAGNIAMLAGVGSLVFPTTKNDYQNKLVELPSQLFAHNWQQLQWQLSTADAADKVGWGGRIADAIQASGVNNNASVSMNISLAGSNFFLSGREVTSYAVRPDGATELNVFGTGGRAERRVIESAFSDLLALQDNPAYSRSHYMRSAHADITKRARVSAGIINGIDDAVTLTTAVPPQNPLASQLAMVAKLIKEGQNTLNHQRQVFFCATGGYDNHDGLVGTPDQPLSGPHYNNLKQLNDAIKYFHDVLGELNMRDQVTTFTASDFGRTQVSNGNGSDHGWSAHHMIMGGSQVNGGQLFGEYPDLTIDGPDDTGRGRYIPKISVDQYSFELAKWFGVPLSEMPTIFPNLDRFLDVNNPSTHLGMLI